MYDIGNSKLVLPWQLSLCDITFYVMRHKNVYFVHSTANSCAGGIKVKGGVGAISETLVTMLHLFSFFVCRYVFAVLTI